MEISIWRKLLDNKVLSVAYKAFALISFILLGILWLPLPLILAMLSIVLAGILFLVIKGVVYFRPLLLIPSYQRIVLHSFAVSIILLAAPIYYLCYQSYFKSIELPLVTLSNGIKTVKFQGMIHVGPRDFYMQIVNNLDEASKQGYTLFFEGVDSTPNRQEWTKRTLLRNQDLNSSYSKITNILGLDYQEIYFRKYKELAIRSPSNFVNADVSTQDLFKEYLRLWRESREFRTKMRVIESKRFAPDSGSLKRISRWQKSGGPARRFLLRRMSLGIYAFMVSSDSQQIENFRMNKFKNSAESKLILDFRDGMLVKRIIEHPSNKIYITYGLAHLPGVLDRLKKSDPKWIVQKKEITQLVLPKY
jgi:hypothetical protein